MAEIKVYKMFNNVTATAASVDIQEDGEICAVLLENNAIGADALGDGIQSELSFSSVSGFTSNDTRASVIGALTTQQFLTSGGGPVNKSVFITFAPHGIPVAAGERLFLHILVSAAPTSIQASCWIYFCVGGSQTKRARVGRRTR